MSETPCLDIRHTLADPDLHLWEHVGTSKRLVVCFSGIGEDADAVPPLEFARTATNNGQDHVLYVADPNRQWLNGPGQIEKIVGHIEKMVRQTGATEIMTLGHSMGGYSAAIIGDFVKVDVAVCMSPQTSVHPDVVGDENRWLEERSGITEHRIRSVVDHIVPETEYYVFFGGHYRERRQRDRFPLGDNIKFYILEDLSHRTPLRMKKEGILEDVIQQCFANHPRRVLKTLQQKLKAWRVTRPTRDMRRRARWDSQSREGIA